MTFPSLKGYPPGFWGLFVTQTCSSFSFYGLKAIFILYMMRQLSLSASESIALFATFMALSYMSSLIGGWVADHLLGLKNTIILGGLSQALGIALLMIPSQGLYALALSIASLGAGALKPTLSGAVGSLFENPQDPAKDKAYSTFYIAMNLGSLTGPLFCGLVAQRAGAYHNSLLLLMVVLLGGVYICYKNVKVIQEKKSAVLSKRFFSRPLLLGGVIVAQISLFYWVFLYSSSFHHLMGMIALGSIFYFGKIFYCARPEERTRLISILSYILFFTFFCALFEQSCSSIILFLDRIVERTVFGREIPVSSFLSLGPLFVLVCGPLLILFSSKILERERPFEGYTKIGIGFVCTALAFATFALGCLLGHPPLSSGWVVVAIFFQTLGELWVVPIGFSNVSKLSSPQLQASMMSFCLMAIAYGHYFAGMIAQFSIQHVINPDNLANNYFEFFFNLSFLPCALACGAFLYRFIERRRS